MVVLSAQAEMHEVILNYESELEKARDQRRDEAIEEGENSVLDAVDEESSGVYSEEEAGSINDDFEFLVSESSVYEEGYSDSYDANDESSYAYSEDESSAEERCNDEAHDGLGAFAFASSRDSSSSIYPLTQRRGSLTDKHNLEGILNQVDELKARLDAMDVDDDTEDDQFLNQVNDQLQDETSRRDDNERTLERLVNDVDGLRIDVDSIELIVNALLGRSCGHDTLASMSRQRSIIDAIKRSKLNKFRNEQLERAEAMERRAALEERNRNMFQFSEEDSDEVSLFPRRRRR